MKFDPTLNWYPMRSKREKIGIEIRTLYPNGHLQVIDVPMMVRKAYLQLNICHRRKTFFGTVTRTIQFDRVFFTGDRYYLKISVASQFKGTVYSEIPEGYSLRDLVEPQLLEQVSHIIDMPVSWLGNENGVWLIVEVQ